MLAMSVAGCGTLSPASVSGLHPDSQGSAVELADTVFFPQEDFQCGPAALATSLQAAGVDITPPELTAKVYLPARQGSLQAELVAATRRYGRVPYLLEPDLGHVIAELQAGRPVLVLQNLGLPVAPVWHYAVVVGYLPQQKAMVLRSGIEKRMVVDVPRFSKTWETAGAWALVILRPGELPARAEPNRYIRAVSALEQTGQIETAQRGYAAALERWPELPTAWLGLGNTEYALGRLHSAESAFRRVTAIRPEDPIAHNNLAYVLAERGCFAQAALQITLALQAGPLTPAIRQELLDTREQIAVLRDRAAPRQAATACTAG